MDADTIFRIFLAPAAGLIWTRYLSWPIILIVTGLLIFHKFKHITALQGYLLIVWWAIMFIGMLVLISLLLAFLTMPKNDMEIRGILYFTFALSLPILIPMLIAIFFKPSSN